MGVNFRPNSILSRLLTRPWTLQIQFSCDTMASFNVLCRIIKGFGVDIVDAQVYRLQNDVIATQESP